MCFLPRRALNVSECEIARAYKVFGTSVEPISFIVPRKVSRAINLHVYTFSAPLNTHYSETTPPSQSRTPSKRTYFLQHHLPNQHCQPLSSSTARQRLATSSTWTLGRLRPALRRRRFTTSPHPPRAQRRLRPSAPPLRSRFSFTDPLRTSRSLLPRLPLPQRMIPNHNLPVRQLNTARPYLPSLSLTVVP